MRAFAGLAGVSLLAAASFGLGSWWVALRLDPAAGGVALFAGTACALIGSLVASVLPSAFVHAPPAHFVGAIVANLALRLFVTLVVALLVAPLLGSQRDAVLIWTGIAQLVVLAADTYALTRLARRLGTEA